MNDQRTFPLIPERASTIAGQVDAVTIYLLVVSGAISLLILVLIVWFVIRYRRRRADEVPPPTVTHTWLEITWILIPLALAMGMFFWGASVYVKIKRPPKNALVIHVIGKQWMWKIQHPGGQREIDELHVPVGRTVQLIMTSQDVIHSFSIPAFRIKQDVLPGSYSTLWFEATRPGVYHLFCAEYCGTMHSRMVGRVVAMTPADYEAWLAGTVPDELPEAAGARLFSSYGCAQCHGAQAPTMAGLYGRQVRLSDGTTVLADEQYLRQSILDPSAKLVAGYPPLMPTYQGQLSEEQILQLLAYIKSLGAARADTPGGAPDVAAPATRPVTGFPPTQLPNQPPAHQPPRIKSE